jgi:hypothetical protein
MISLFIQAAKPELLMAKIVHHLPHNQCNKKAPALDAAGLTNTLWRQPLISYHRKNF